MQKRTVLLIKCAIFAALTALCAQIQVPLYGVPLSLALLPVLMAGAMLGVSGGVLSVSCYLLLGAVGLPVFNGFTGGLGVLTGPTGGYLAGYLACAAVTALLVKKRSGGFGYLCLCMGAGVLVCYTLGTAWFCAVTGSGLVSALGVCVLPFLPGDAVKIALAAYLAPRLKRATANLG